MRFTYALRTAVTHQLTERNPFNEKACHYCAYHFYGWIYRPHGSVFLSCRNLKPPCLVGRNVSMKQKDAMGNFDIS